MKAHADIRGDLSFVHLYCTDAAPASCRRGRCGTAARRIFTLQEKTFASDDKITAVYRQFLLANDWRQPANQLTLSAAKQLTASYPSDPALFHRAVAFADGHRRAGARRKRHVLAWIDAHLDQPLTLADPAQQAGLSEFHLLVCFVSR